MTDTSENPLLQTEGYPQYDRIEPDHVVVAVRHMLEQAETRLAEIEQAAVGSWSGVIEPLETIECLFEQTWQPVNHLLGVRNSQELREAHETVLNEVVQFGLRVSQSKPIYQSFRSMKDGEEWAKLDAAQKRIINQRLLQAELAGIDLEGEQRQRFNEIASELSQLSTDFSNNVLDATKAFSLVLTDEAEIEGLPESLLQLAAQSYNEWRESQSSIDSKSEAAVLSATAENGPWRITLDPPCLQPFLQHSRRRDLREKLYRAFVTRASEGDYDNTDAIRRILSLRKEKSALLGLETYAQVSLAQKMAPDADAVQRMFEQLRSAAWEPAHADMEALQELADVADSATELKHWDVAFWAERLRESRFDYTDEELRPYFPLARVLEGLFGLVNRLFGIVVEPADGQAAVWNSGVRLFKIFDESGAEIASFFLDPYSRPEEKRGGAWMDECLTRRIRPTGPQLPVAHLVCNSTPPVGDKPSLMTFREVTTLFHEFGHGLQHMLTTVDYADASGINGIEWDAVELASQFLENWIYHKPTIMTVSGHFETGGPLPDELFEKLLAARTFRAGSDMLRQLLFGMTDMALHSTYDPSGDESAFDVQKRITEKTSVLPMLPEDRFLCGFQHIFAGGYAAGYYSYKWAEVLSADAFAAFEEADFADDEAIATTGRRFRDTVLALGGSQHPMDVFRAFRGREPSVDALLRHNGLMSESKS
jgi:oligopeptidase A